MCELVGGWASRKDWWEGEERASEAVLLSEEWERGGEGGARAAKKPPK